jgi:hypothetical protein
VRHLRRGGHDGQHQRDGGASTSGFNTRHDDDTRRADMRREMNEQEVAMRNFFLFFPLVRVTPKKAFCKCPSRRLVARRTRHASRVVSLCEYFV